MLSGHLWPESMYGCVLHCMFVLQTCMDVVKEGTGNCNGTGVICDGDGTDELEEAIDIEDEIPEAISFPPIKTEQEVRVWVMCEVVAVHAV